MRRVIFLLIISGAGLAILIGLGTWQLQRKAWKEDLLHTIESNIAAVPAGLPQSPVEKRDRYLAVTAEGEIEGNELHVFWVTKDAETGYRVIAPFVTSDGRRVLVDRGFISAAKKNMPLNYGAASVTGNLLWPDEGDWTTPAPAVDTNILYARDVAYMAERLNTEPVLIVARSATPEAAVTPHAVTTAGIPNNHLQYAITWFSLAVIWAAMTLYFLRRSRP
ncbi:cytochrome oxidase biogenesis protein Surf1, facilitates heme A insertion [Leisingera sp. ANG-M1]|uniref:SURF1 family protein n=1 Tax=Leisingera sp. ANG-M1 TaxID=1577895 RepID=UPI00057D1759|nr:SURF1 family protein [Leisingera sp. ANG-M1]KIC09900.1 cytochrome oxidase biogenesis protein Surf1, facilitates heme A insertion [Leisingera sp. ANG-M1]